MFLFSVSGAMDVALGSAAAGVFTNSDWLWGQLHKVKRLMRLHVYGTIHTFRLMDPHVSIVVYMISGKCHHR